MSEIDEMDASEVSLWQYYLVKEPRGERRSDWNTAQICHAIYTFMIGLSNGDISKVKLEDNLLKFKEIETADNEIEKQKAIAMKTAMALMSSFGVKTPKKLDRDLKKMASKDFDITSINKSDED